MRPSPILRCLTSTRLPLWWYTSSVVVPLPQQSLFSRQITSKFDDLPKPPECIHATYTSLVAALDASITTQKQARRSLVDKKIHHSNTKFIDEYLVENVELLDACNGLLEKMEMIRTMVDSSRVVTHLLERGPNRVALKRVRELLAGRKFRYLGKCRSNLRRLDFSQCWKNEFGEADHKLDEILRGPKIEALIACHFLEMALSFKSKHGLKNIIKSLGAITARSSSLLVAKKVVQKRSYPWMMAELRDMIMAVEGLCDQVKRYDDCDDRELRVSVEALKGECERLERGIEQMEGRVKELYGELISIRMALLGILSSQ